MARARQMVDEDDTEVVTIISPDDEADVTPARRRRGRAAVAEVEVVDQAHSVFDVMKLLDATAIIDTAQKQFKLAGVSYDADARRESVVSTGMLCNDLLLNGGLYPGGWYGVSGPEGAAKSTGVNTMFCSLYHSNVPMVGIYDPEGSTSPEYIETIARTSSREREINISKAFGVRDPKNQERWVIEPRIHYFPENSLEAIWRSMNSILRKLPDKLYDVETGKWWLLFDNSKINISRFKGQGNSKLGARYGKIAIEALDGPKPQAVFVVDSIAAMVSAADDDDDDQGNGSIGLEARGHARHAKKVKGRLKRKHAIVLVTNQVRDVISLGGPNYGPKTYEPGGRYLGHAKDATLNQTPRAIPHASGQLEEEASVTSKGFDTYRYICLKTSKNKFGPPFLEVWQRIWLSDSSGTPRGFCPVYDTYDYLKKTGQLRGSISDKATIYIDIKDEDGLQVNKISWLDFKALILLEGEDLRAYCGDLGILTNPKIRERCFTQIREGDGMDRYFSTMHGIDVEGEEQAYASMTMRELLKDAVARGLTDRKAGRKLVQGDLIELLESDDAG